MKRTTTIKIAILVVSVVLGLLVAEGGLRLIRPQIFDVHPRGLYLEDPNVGYVLAPGFEGWLERSEFRVKVTTGRHGMRGSEPPAPSERTFRILVLGDSLAWGFGVEDDETLAVRLEALLSERHPDLDFQVLNGGVPGYGTADQLALLRSRGPALGPDLVIVQFLSVNDLEENRSPASEWAAVSDGMLVNRSGRGPSPDAPVLRRFQRYAKSRSHLANLISNSAGYLAMRFGLFDDVDQLWGEDFTAEDADRTTTLLVALARQADELGAKTLFLYTTAQAQVFRDEYSRPRSAQVVAEAGRLADVPWIDVTESLRARDDKYDLYYPRDGHWTAAGHETVAEIVAEEVEDLVASCSRLEEDDAP